MITITDFAKKKLLEFAESEGVAPSIRIKNIGGGCNGMQTDLTFDEAVSDTDEIFRFDGVQIIVDEISFMYLEDVSIDYIENEFMGSGFKIFDPNIKSSCGCGKSFSY